MDKILWKNILKDVKDMKRYTMFVEGLWESKENISIFFYG